MVDPYRVVTDTGLGLPAAPVCHRDSWSRSNSSYRQKFVTVLI